MKFNSGKIRSQSVWHKQGGGERETLILHIFEVLFPVKIRFHLRCSSAGIRDKENVIYAHRVYSCLIIKNIITSFVGKWVKLEFIMINQTQKDRVTLPSHVPNTHTHTP